MVGKRTTCKSLTAKVSDNGWSEKKSMSVIDEENQTWSELPSDLLEVIMSSLVLKDNIRSSAVCKTWHKAANSVRVVDQHPWLIDFHERCDVYGFYDPIHHTGYTFKLPELAKSEFRYSKDGWLLMNRWSSDELFFFNPFTRVLMNLPTLKVGNHRTIAFSCAPTSSNCLLFTLTHISLNEVSISTCHPGDTEWTTENFTSEVPFASCIQDKVVFCSGLFYCLDVRSRVGVFDPSVRTWNVLPLQGPIFPNHFLEKRYMAEHKGDIFVIYSWGNENPIVFRLNLEVPVWEQMKTLEGMTIFASQLSCVSRSYVAGPRRNSLYFPRIRMFGKRCIWYSVDEGRLYPRKHCYYWEEQGVYKNIWIEPPKNVSELNLQCCSLSDLE